MADRPFKAAIAADEKQMSQEIADLITKALGTSAVMKEANKLQGEPKAKTWPAGPNGKVILHYGKVANKAWSKLKTKYRAIEVEIELQGYGKGRPYVCCTAKYTGEIKGGGSRMITKGDTIMSIAKEVYGYDCYAETIWDHNSKTLGSQCKQLPVGFGIELPRIFVPDWLKPPSAKLAAGAKASAVEIPAPPLEIAWSKSAASYSNLVCGPVIITITCLVEGSVTGVKTTPVSESFTFANYQGQFKKAVGPYQTSFNLALNANESGVELGLFNSKVKGLEFSGKLKLISGGAQISLGVAATSKKSGDLSIKGSFSASAKIQMQPNPDYVGIEAAAAARGAAITVGGLVLLAGGAVAIQLGRGAAAAASELPGGIKGLKELLNAQTAGANALRPCLGF